jgi:hypothetical protein
MKWNGLYLLCIILIIFNKTQYSYDIMYAWGIGTLPYSKKRKWKCINCIHLCGIFCFPALIAFYRIIFKTWIIETFLLYRRNFTEKNQITEIVLHVSCRLEWQGFMSVVFLFITQVSQMHLWLFGCNFWVMTLACQPCMPSQHSKYSKVQYVGLILKADSTNTKHIRCFFF